MVTGREAFRINGWTEAIHQARAAGEPIAPIVIDYNMVAAGSCGAGMAGNTDRVGLPHGFSTRH